MWFSKETQMRDTFDFFLSLVKRKRLQEIERAYFVSTGIWKRKKGCPGFEHKVQVFPENRDLVDLSAS